MGATRFDIKVLHQGHPTKERGTAAGFREELGEAAKGLKDTVLTLQGIGGRGRPLLHGELQEQVDRVAVFVEETLEAAGQGLDTSSLDHDGGVLQVSDQTGQHQDADTFIAWGESLEGQGQDGLQLAV